MWRSLDHVEDKWKKITPASNIFLAAPYREFFLERNERVFVKPMLNSTLLSYKYKKIIIGGFKAHLDGRFQLLNDTDMSLHFHFHLVEGSHQIAIDLRNLVKLSGLHLEFLFPIHSVPRGIWKVHNFTNGLIVVYVFFGYGLFWHFFRGWIFCKKIMHVILRAHWRTSKPEW